MYQVFLESRDKTGNKFVSRATECSMQKLDAVLREMATHANGSERVVYRRIG